MKWYPYRRRNFFLKEYHSPKYPWRKLLLFLYFEFDQCLTQLLTTGTGKNSMIRICWQQHRTASQGLPCSRRQWAWGLTQRWRWGWPPPAPSPAPSPPPAPSRGTGDHQQINHMWSWGDRFLDWTWPDHHWQILTPNKSPSCSQLCPWWQWLPWSQRRRSSWCTRGWRGRWGWCSCSAARLCKCHSAGNTAPPNKVMVIHKVTYPINISLFLSKENYLIFVWILVLKLKR